MTREEHSIKSVEKSFNNAIPLKCPTCGAKIEYNDKNVAICSYCGVSVILRNKLIKQEKVTPSSIEQLDDGNHETHDITDIKKTEKWTYKNKMIALIGTGLLSGAVVATASSLDISQFTLHADQIRMIEDLQVLFGCFGMAGVFGSIIAAANTYFNKDEEEEKNNGRAKG